ncbi:MAG TPA: hypothetical protein H9875_07270 [Candidatus Levilactobacillus faecigallinarum]|uniref:Uncharacterized protein n=1 Tax=Candidatus Levilactobacillus faecigallinarum TaxID=2838638 RepID=A0A9D1QTK8_9LACO|nr:hypothetical protein [Candidatus Levilactobacillus faecigallinarum]
MTDPRDSDYMTFYEYLDRLRKDLNEPTLHAMEGKAPSSEEEYLNAVKSFRELFAKVDKDYS